MIKQNYILLFAVLFLLLWIGCMAFAEQDEADSIANRDSTVTAIADTSKQQIDAEKILWTPPLVNPCTDLIYRMRWTEALESLKTAVYLDTLDRIFLAGYANFQLGENARAESLFAYLFALDYDLNDWVTVYLARSAYRNGDYELAYQVAKSAGMLPGLIDKVAYIRWKSLWKMGKKTEALSELDILYKTGLISKWRYKSNRAICLRDTGNVAEARKIFTEILNNVAGKKEFRSFAIEVASEFGTIEELSQDEIILIAKSFYYAKEYDSAVIWFAKIEDLDKKSKLKYYYAVSLIRTKQYSKSLQFFRELRKAKSYNRPSLWWRIGQVQRKLGELDSAGVALDSALAQCKNNTTRVNVLKEKLYIAQEDVKWYEFAEIGKNIAKNDIGGNDGSIGLVWAIIGYIHADSTDSALACLRRYRRQFDNPDFIDELTYWEARVFLASGDTASADSVIKWLAERPRQNVFVWMAKEQFDFTFYEPDSFFELPAFTIDSIYEQAKRTLNELYKQQLVSIPENQLKNRAEHLARLGIIEHARSAFKALEGQGVFGNSPAMKLELWRYYYSLRLYSLAAKKGASLCLDINNPPKELLRLQYIMPFPKFVEERASEENIDPFFVFSTMMQESFFDPHARSYANARGLMQFIPSTGSTVAGWLKVKDFEPEMLYDYQLSISFGARLLAELLENRGRLHFALAEYNAGDKPVDRWIEFCPDTTDIILCSELFDYRQTRIYAKRILGFYCTYHWLYKDFGEKSEKDGK